MDRSAAEWARHHEKRAKRLYEQGDLEAALHHFREAQRFGIDGYRDSPGFLAVTHHQIGCVLRELGRLDEALTQFERGFAAAQSIGGREEVAALLARNIGGVHAQRERHEQALAAYHDAERLFLAADGVHHANLADLHLDIAQSHRQRGEHDESLSRLRSAEVLLTAAHGPDNAALARCAWLAGEIHEARGDTAAAREQFEHALLNCVRHDVGSDDIAQAARKLAALGEDPIELTRLRIGSPAAAKVRAALEEV